MHTGQATPLSIPDATPAARRAACRACARRKAAWIACAAPRSLAVAACEVEEASCVEDAPITFVCRSAALAVDLSTGAWVAACALVTDLDRVPVIRR